METNPTHFYPYNPLGFNIMTTKLPELLNPPLTAEYDLAWMETLSGQQVCLTVPEESTIDLWDICTGLSRQCRYVGQCRKFYSVAEHSLKVYQHAQMLGYAGLLPGHVGTPIDINDNFDLVLGLLLHDAHEYILHDLSRVIKYIFKQYTGIYTLMAERVQNAIHSKFGVVLNSEELSIISQADCAVFQLEAYHLMPSRGRGWKLNYDPAIVTPHIEPTDGTCYFPLERDPASMEYVAEFFHNKISDYL